MFTENETNFPRLFGVAGPSPYVKDAFHESNRERQAGAESDATGTKAAAQYTRTVAAGQTVTLQLRLSALVDDHPLEAPFADFDALIAQRREEADEFYQAIHCDRLSADAKLIARQAFAGMLWSKQYYHFVVTDWLKGDPAEPVPPQQRRDARNHEWPHLFSRDIISMPDKWEFPWFASWDLAFIARRSPTSIRISRRSKSS